ncbi:MAG: hypothetical protein GY814_16755 [Gammaproteobacteria bacterium]|nr:hypothetical protein [Gammaproteobacteria bacterium]
MHQDAGWDHYANKWDVLDEKGEMLGTRILHHPHVKERPFARSLSWVEVPLGIEKATIHAHDSMHKYDGKIATVQLP